MKIILVQASSSYRSDFGLHFSPLFFTISLKLMSRWSIYTCKVGRLHGSFENRVYYDKIIASIMVVFGIGGLGR